MTKIVESDLKLIASMAMKTPPIYGILLSEPNEKYHQFLYLLARFMEPNLSVELGTYRGEGAKYLALGAPDSRVITIDINPDAKRVVENEDLILPNVFAVTANCVDHYFEQGHNYGPIDLLHIDANHDYSLTMFNFNNWGSLVRPGGVIALDDWTLDSEMLRVRQELIDRGEQIVELNELHHTGYACVIKGS